MPLDVGFSPADVNNFFKQWLDFCYKHQIINSPTLIDESIAYDVIRLYVGDKASIKNYHNLQTIDITKRMACMAFWIRKLKPLHYQDDCDPDILNYLNEVFGLTIALVSCEVEVPFPIKIEPPFFKDLLWYFRYKSVSPDSLYIILKSIVTDCRATGYSI